MSSPAAPGLTCRTREPPPGPSLAGGSATTPGRRASWPADRRPLLVGEPSPLLAAHLSHFLAAAGSSSLANGASFLAASLLATGGCFVGENERAVAGSGGEKR